MNIREIECILLDDTYEEDDFNILAKIVYNPQGKSKLYAWDGLEWSEKGFNRVYTNRNNQYAYDAIVNRIFQLRDNGLIFEIASKLNEDESYYFEEERIYIYIEDIKE